MGKPTPAAVSTFVFDNGEGKPYISTSINHLHRKAFAPVVIGKPKPLFPGDFVLHSLRHTMLTRLGEAGVDAFTIMRIAGHSSIVVSQRYIHPTPEAVERLCSASNKETGTRTGTTQETLSGVDQ